MSILSWFTGDRVTRSARYLVLLAVVLVPAICFADVEGSLINIKSKLTRVILPLISVIGLGIASISFFTGNPQAKQHIVYAILGCCFGFGAQQIVDLISSMVR